ncbi:MAG: T9SS type A sorting domain-containing protein [Saprospiraceae bacterium]
MYQNFFFVLIVLLSTSTFSTAQIQLPNNGFEEWITDTVPPINNTDELVGWTTSNFIVNAGANPTVFKTTDAAVGNFAVRITTDTSVVPVPFGDGSLDTIAGFVALGIVNQLSTGGIAYIDRPLQLSAWIKGTVIPSDTCAILVDLTGVDDNSSIDVLIGRGQILLTETDTIYRKVTTNITYFSDAQPECLKVRLNAGGSRNSLTIFPNNEFFVDELVLEGGVVTATDESLAAKQKVKVMPNPMKNQAIVEFENPNREPLHFSLFNSKGQKVRENLNLTGNQLLLEKGNLPKGFYFFNLSNKQQVVYSGKLLIR